MVAAVVSDPSLATAALHLSAAKYFEIAAFVVLVYDHVLTFSEEVERIWKQRISGASILFLINRYITPIQFIILTHAFNNSIWTPSMGVFTLYHTRCNRFVAFEGSGTIALIAVCELIMILRVYALYGRRLVVLGGLMILWVVQLVMGSIGMTTGFAVPLPPGLVGCIFTGTSSLFSAQWVFPLVTDSVIFLLTLWRTGAYLLRSGNAPTLHIFVRDGVVYFLVIFVANLMNTLIFFLAVDDLKAIGASFSQLITSTVVSRLVLNLRSSSVLTPGESHALSLTTHARMSFMTRTIGNLGEEMDFSSREDDYDIPMHDRAQYLKGSDTLWAE